MAIRFQVVIICSCSPSINSTTGGWNHFFKATFKVMFGVKPPPTFGRFIKKTLERCFPETLTPGSQSCGFGRFGGSNVFPFQLLGDVQISALGGTSSRWYLVIVVGGLMKISLPKLMCLRISLDLNCEHVYHKMDMSNVYLTYYSSKVLRACNHNC